MIEVISKHFTDKGHEKLSSSMSSQPSVSSGKRQTPRTKSGTVQMEGTICIMCHEN